jgi:ligand-binding sensor domain-containing protein
MSTKALVWIGVLLLAAASVAAVALPRPGPAKALVIGPVRALEPDAEADLPPLVDAWAPPATIQRPALVYDHFETIGRADGLPSERVTTVLVEGETLYVGTDQGLAIRQDGAWTTWTPANGLAHRYVTSLARDPRTGDLWISTLKGLSRLAGGVVRTYKQTNSGLMNDVVYHVVVADGLVVAATAAGTSVLDVRAGTWAVYDHENSIMHEPWCYAVAAGRQHLWIGVWGGGIVELDRRTGRWREYLDPDGEMELDLLRDDGPIHDVTSFVAYDAGVLWQATYFGLARYDGRQWRSYLKADTGLPGDFINHVAARGHTAWIASDEGFGVFDGETCVAYRRQEDGTCEVRVRRAGGEAKTHTLPTAPADNYVLWAQGGQDEVWLATGAGLTHGTATGGAR